MDLTIISSVASLILAVVAIWLSLHHKRDVDKVNKDTRDLLAEIRIDANTLAKYAAPELEKYGDTMRAHLVATRTYSSASQTQRQNVNNSTLISNKPFRHEEFVDLIGQIQSKIGMVTPVKLILDTKDRLSAGDIIELVRSSGKKGLIEWDSQPNTPDADEEIRLTKIV